MSIPARQPTGIGLEHLHLVLIEDSAEYAWLVEEMLADAFGRDEVKFSTFTTLGEATPALGEADCVLVDLGLPDVSGLEVVERVQELAPALPVVVLTGAEDEELALRAVELGAQDYLVKRRADPEVLHRSIRYAVERKRGEGQRAELLQARAAQAEAEALSLTLARLQELGDAAVTVPGERLDYDGLLRRSLALISTELGVLLLRDRRGSLVAMATSGVGTPRRGQQPELGEAAREAILASEPVVLDAIDPGEAGDFGPAAGVRSLLAVPLEADGDHIGSLVAVSSVEGRFSTEQARLLALAGERYARALAIGAAYERERKTSVALQAGLLPQAVPQLRRGEIAVRYLPAKDGPPVGGDWYDAVELPGGQLGLVMGDVTGHGAEAAILMGQLRIALRAYAVEGAGPAEVLERLNALALSLGDAAIATVAYVVLEPGLTQGSYVLAGHPPPIVVRADGGAPLDAPPALPVGVTPDAGYAALPLTLEPGDALCLYSDGLVEERGTDILERERLLAEALGTPTGAEVLCERALAGLRPHGPGDDDVALLVIRTSATEYELRATHPATPEGLSPARTEVRDWLLGLGASQAEVSDMVMAANEACMNVVEHAYERAGGEFAIEGYLDGDTVVIIVRDLGRWTEVQSRGRGRGLKVMEALMDSVQLSFSAEGTVVVMRRELGRSG